MTELSERPEVQRHLPAPKVNRPADDASAAFKDAFHKAALMYRVMLDKSEPTVTEPVEKWRSYIDLGKTADSYGGPWGKSDDFALQHALYGEPVEVKWFEPELEFGTSVKSYTGSIPVTEHLGFSAPLHIAPTMANVDVLPLHFGAVNVDPLTSYEGARRQADASRDSALEEIRRRVDAAKAVYARMSPRDVVGYLTQELGVGQLLVARAVGVSPTAVRKWRRGEAARPEHRNHLSRFAAFSQLLTEMGPFDPAGWLDIPVSSESTLTPLDLFAAGRADLVLLHAADLAEPHETLDLYSSDWRSRYPMDADYEVVTMTDGTHALLPRARE